jgi:hypothetical protein
VHAAPYTNKTFSNKIDELAGNKFTMEYLRQKNKIPPHVENIGIVLTFGLPLTQGFVLEG